MQFNWKIKLAFIAFGIILSLTALEITARILYQKPRGTEFKNLKELRSAMLDESSDDMTSTDQAGANLRGLVAPHLSDEIIYDLIPNLETTFQRAPVKINSCGMRGPERRIAKPPGTFRIALLGDSFAFGWGVRQEEGFAQRLEDNLNRISRGQPNFEILNLGVPGYSTFQEVAKFVETGLDFKPDAVVVFFIENDFGYPFYVHDIHNPGSMLPALTFARLTWKAIDPKIEEQKQRLEAYDPNRALAKLSDICRDLGIPLYFTINPKKGWKGHKKKLWILRERPDIRFISMRQELMEIIERDKIPEKDLTLTFDPHPSALRHALYGQLLTPYFMEYIR